ncbi:hypothetical protein MMC15_006333 [Xylographa vitiligo]|nr:hypothetical protein [Xylographa vitiligo]
MFLLESKIQPSLHVTSNISGRRICYDQKWGYNDGIDFENSGRPGCHFPPLPQYLKDIEVDFRVLNYGHTQFVGYGYNGYRGAGRILKRLLKLLGGFFAYGPQFSLGREPPFPFCVDTIPIIFWRVEETQGWLDTKKREDSVRGPIRKRKEWLEKLQLTGLLWEKVRRIRLCWDWMANEWQVFDQRENGFARAGMGAVWVDTRIPSTFSPAGSRVQE